MSKEKTDYSKFTLDPVKDVLVNPKILVELQQFIHRVKDKHTTANFPQQITWYSKKDHTPLSSKKKISDEKRDQDYYRNVDLDKTEKRGTLVYDDLAMSSIKLQAAYEEIFRYNVDQGNCIPREQEPTQPPVEADESK